MKIIKGDKVKVITGKYKGTIANVISTLPKKDKVVVEGVNMIKKAMKPTQANPDGGFVEREAPIHVSNVMLYDSKSKKVSRVGYKIDKDTKVRVYKTNNNVVKGGK